MSISGEDSGSSKFRMNPRSPNSAATEGQRTHSEQINRSKPHPSEDHTAYSPRLATTNSLPNAQQWQKLNGPLRRDLEQEDKRQQWIADDHVPFHVATGSQNAAPQYDGMYMEGSFEETLAQRGPDINAIIDTENHFAPIQVDHDRQNSLPHVKNPPQRASKAERVGESSGNLQPHYYPQSRTASRQIEEEKEVERAGMIARNTRGHEAREPPISDMPASHLQTRQELQGHADVTRQASPEPRLSLTAGRGTKRNRDVLDNIEGRLVVAAAHTAAGKRVKRVNVAPHQQDDAGRTRATLTAGKYPLIRPQSLAGTFHATLPSSLAPYFSRTSANAHYTNAHVPPGNAVESASFDREELRDSQPTRPDPSIRTQAPALAQDDEKEQDPPPRALAQDEELELHDFPPLAPLRVRPRPITPQSSGFHGLVGTKSPFFPAGFHGASLVSERESNHSRNNEAIGPYVNAEITNVSSYTYAADNARAASGQIHASWHALGKPTTLQPNNDDTSSGSFPIDPALLNVPQGEANALKLEGTHAERSQSVKQSNNSRAKRKEVFSLSMPGMRVPGHPPRGHTDLTGMTAEQIVSTCGNDLHDHVFLFVRKFMGPSEIAQTLPQLLPQKKNEGQWYIQRNRNTRNRAGLPRWERTLRDRPLSYYGLHFDGNAYEYPTDPDNPFAKNTPPDVRSRLLVDVIGNGPSYAPVPGASFPNYAGQPVPDPSSAATNDVSKKTLIASHRSASTDRSDMSAALSATNVSTITASTNTQANGCGHQETAVRPRSQEEQSVSSNEANPPISPLAIVGEGVQPRSQEQESLSSNETNPPNSPLATVDQELLHDPLFHGDPLRDVEDPQVETTQTEPIERATREKPEAEVAGEEPPLRKQPSPML